MSLPGQARATRRAAPSAASRGSGRCPRACSYPCFVSSHALRGVAARDEACHERELAASPGCFARDYGEVHGCLSAQRQPCFAGFVSRPALGYQSRVANIRKEVCCA